MSSLRPREEKLVPHTTIYLPANGYSLESFSMPPPAVPTTFGDGRVEVLHPPRDERTRQAPTITRLHAQYKDAGFSNVRITGGRRSNTREDSTMSHPLAFGFRHCTYIHARFSCCCFFMPSMPHGVGTPFGLAQDLCRRYMCVVTF